MNDHCTTETARIRALKTSMVSLLESAREETIPLAQLQQGARLLTAAYQDIFNLGSKQLVNESPADLAATLHAIEDGYSDWRAVEGAFAKTLELAYNGYTTRDNLQADAIFTELRRQVGHPVSALHAKLHAARKEHVSTCPWDEFMMSDAQDSDRRDLNTNLKLLVQGDHLDVEDAVEELTGPLRYSFANYLAEQTDSIDLLEESLWMRPEVVLINDYWGHNPEVRLLDVLTRNVDSKRASSFARVQDLLKHSHSIASASDYIVHELGKVRSDERDVYYRCMMLHPDHEIRRYAVNNVDIEGFWKVATPHLVPCATILSMLEKVAGSQNYDENFQKVFFQTVHKRLFNLMSRSEVLYARGIIRIFANLPFFMENEYFEKLTVLIDYVTAKEKLFHVERGVLDDFKAQLHREKDKIGTLQAQSPTLTSIPPVVLRKLARDGHYWYELSMHPMFKIARETINHINSQDRALRVAKNHVVNQDVLRVVGKKRSLFNSIPAKITLLSNPRTPPTVSIAYIMDLSKTDIAHLLRRSTVHPELRLHLRHRLGK
jgi:hypothetical protein